MSMTHILVITYQGGPDYEFDQRLRVAVGKESDGAGCAMFGKMERDISWTFRSAKGLKEATARAKRAVSRAGRARLRKAKVIDDSFDVDA